MSTSLKPFLGSGLYTLSEAALYARVSPEMLRRWLFGSGRGTAVIDPQYDSDEKLVSFLDLVQALAIREIRIQRSVPLKKFREAIKVARERFRLDHPFARRHCTYLWGNELVIRPSGDEFVEASGRHRGQRLFTFVEMYLKDLSFNPDGLANRYQVYVSPAGVPVVMDPRKRFGEPLLPSGYSVQSLWEAITIEGGIDRAAQAYGVPPAEVEAAYRFLSERLTKTVA